MARKLLISLCIFLATVLVGLGLLYRPSLETSGTSGTPSTQEGLVPVEADEKVVVSDKALPQDAIAVNLAPVARLEPPFALSADATAAGGMAVVLPAGTRDKERSSRARIPFQVTSPGNYTVWLRAFWRNGCGNSIFARIGESPEKTVGHDEVFNVWHWISVGEFELKDGANEMVLREREDGIALDQLLLVRDKEFLPTGRVEKTSFTREPTER